MDFELSERQQDYLGRVKAFMDENVYPVVPTYMAELAANRWHQPAILGELKGKAKAQGLWNLFLAAGPGHGHDEDAFQGAGLTNL